MAKLTPMMRQYMEVKAQYKDAILMFRLGDFYEMFLEDAVEASKILQITLTARNKKGEGEEIPMCGVPYHAVDNYIAKLTRAGKKVALCDQTSTPDGKGIVEREVIRVITPGTTFDENILDQKANNFVAAVLLQAGVYEFAYADVTTGEFKSTHLADDQQLKAEFARLRPSECIVKEADLEHILALETESYVFIFDYKGDSAEEMLAKYLEETQKTELKHLSEVEKYQRAEFMPLDQACIRNLEIFYNNQDGKKDHSLIATIDQTVSALGGRMLRKWLMHPLLQRAEIEERLDKVEKFVADSLLVRKLRELLAGLYDLERLLSKLSLGTGNARDLLALKLSLQIVPEVKALIGEKFPEMNGRLKVLAEVVEVLEKAISEEPPMTINQGGMIRQGFDAELDEYLKLGGEGKDFIAALQKRECERTGVSSLKVKYNKVFGYYIEISKANLQAVPEDYIRKQTLVNAERFITPELKEYEEKVLSAEDKSKQLEWEIFNKLRGMVLEEMGAIQENARALAELDVLSSLAVLALKFDYCKPKFRDEAGLEIKNGRHAVVERMVGDFVANDVSLSEERSFVLLTGPNMGGKSTYLRQIALIVLLAQIGSYVPAEAVEMGVFDRIFTRVGAADNLAKGQSTFMVEMTEAADILQEASERSLVILDELGRGTSTYDGVSIAWAVSEYLHDKVKAKTLFASHYHELVELADKLENAANMSVAVRENADEGVVFLYRVIEGGVDKSYGIEVAKLAGLPREVIARAQGVLDELETKHVHEGRLNPGQMDLFQSDRTVAGLHDAKVMEELKKMEIYKMTPLEVMQKVEEIKQRIDENSKKL